MTAPLAPESLRSLGPPDGVSDLSQLDLETDWREMPRLWGHAFHPMCSYLGSFPASLAHALIERWSRPGDVVLDPFCGRGTVPLQACVDRRIGVGVDRNPLAALLTAAKVDPPTRREATTRLADLRIGWSHAVPEWLAMARAARAAPGAALVPAPPGGRHLLEPLPELAALAFHPATLAQILYVRSTLIPGDRVDTFLTAATLGILHGGSRGYLSTSMPNAFSLAPAYTQRYLDRRGAGLAARDLFPLVLRKLERLHRDGLPPLRGVVLGSDARTAGQDIREQLRSRSLPERVRLVVTSPPYLRLVRYGASNRLRLWFLGHDADSLDRDQMAPHREGAYEVFIGQVLDSLLEVLAADAVLVLVLGDVVADHGRRLASPRRLAESVWRQAAEPAGYRLVGFAEDAVAPMRRATRIWGAEAGRATDTDRLLVISPTEIGRRRALAALRTPVAWSWAKGGRPQGRPGPEAILGRDAADVPPERPRGDGSAGPDEEPRPRPDDEPAPQLHPPATGPSVRAGGQRVAL